MSWRGEKGGWRVKSRGVARERSEQAGGERDGEKSREGRGREEKNVVGALYCTV